MPRVGDVVRVVCSITDKVCVGTLVRKFCEQGDFNPCYEVLWGRSGYPIHYEINGCLYSKNMFSSYYELYRDGVKY